MHLLFCILAILPSFWILCYMSYVDYMLWRRRHEIEEEQIYHRFNGNKDKIRLYKGYKKYFDGDLDVTELRQWFIDHPKHL